MSSIRSSAWSILFGADLTWSKLSNRFTQSEEKTAGIGRMVRSSSPTDSRSFGCSTPAFIAAA